MDVTICTIELRLPADVSSGKDALCLHNPATGRSHRELKHRVAGRGEAGRKVVVVGGGVAGLEAERGHKVVLFEAGSQLGGQVRLAQREWVDVSAHL